MIFHISHRSFNLYPIGNVVASTSLLPPMAIHSPVASERHHAIYTKEILEEGFITRSLGRTKNSQATLQELEVTPSS